MTANTPEPLDFSVIDLDVERKQRAASREGKKADLPIRLGGQIIATLPVELPLDVLEPLRSLDQDLTLVLRSAVQAARSNGDAESRWESTELVIDVLAANPALPVQALDTFVQVAKNLLTDEGYATLMSHRPTPQDIAALAKGVMRFYAITVGESSESSDSSTDSGGTSRPTSSTTTESTSETSTPTPAIAPSSESVAS